ncbi:rubredoxin [Ottowia testudinis]|uniref:Rubredoxin n=1 Tax=Ottowia testudinis TaxID=2816950 RepID=A0A975CHQ6_9BURK|nr:rubredoxin [Ottowia testudinis]QTD46405.1 rubredoxin [Ottowia testudinis]
MHQHLAPANTAQTQVCLACGLVYDPALGLPEHGIAPGTPWAAVPADWKCPECGVDKNDFEAM